PIQSNHTRRARIARLRNIGEPRRVRNQKSTPSEARAVSPPSRDRYCPLPHPLRMVCRKALGAWMLTAVVAWSCGSEPNDTAENSTAAGSSTDAPGGGTSAADATATNGVGTSAPGNATSGAGSDGSPTASTPTTGTAAPNDTSGAPT